MQQNNKTLFQTCKMLIRQNKDDNDNNDDVYDDGFQQLSLCVIVSSEFIFTMLTGCSKLLNIFWLVYDSTFTTQTIMWLQSEDW